MITRYLMIFAVMFLVSACSTTDDGMVDETGASSQRETISDGPLADVYGENMGGGAGTQADLVVNVGDRVFFGYDRYDLSAEARSTLDNQANWLQQNAGSNITIEGHADERGTREYNLALGERRANAVKNYLVALGVSAGRVNVVSYGKERPAVPGSNETAWAQNRRAVTKIN